MKKIAMCLAGVLSAFCAFSAQMASQPWVNSRLDELHSNILDEVSHFAPSGGVSKAYVDSGLALKQDKLTAGTGITISPSGVISATGGGGGQDYNPDTDMWVENGTNLCFMANGVKVVTVIKNVETTREVPGFFVISDGNSNGAVSNGMFYAEISNGRFYCPSNKRIPYIGYDGIATQVIDSVTNEYQNLKIIETRTPTNGTPYSVRWVSIQRNNKDFWCIDEGDVSWEEPKVFKIRMTYGPAVNEYGASGASFFYRLFAAFATSYSVNVNGTSGVIHMEITDTEGKDHPIDVPISFKFNGGEADGWWKDPYDIETEDYIEHHTFEPNPGIPYDEFTQLGRWIDSSISYAYVLSDGTIVNKTIPLAQLTKILGSQLQTALQRAWTEQQEIIWTEQKPDKCAKGNHYYMEKTCTCRKCGHRREHVFPDSFDGDNCKRCINLVGYVEDPTSTKCGGYSQNESDHTGYHHIPAAGWYDPYEKSGHHPLSMGFAGTCSCQCGNFTGNHDPTDEYYYQAGDLIGEGEFRYHSKVLSCSRYNSSTFPQFGWKAVVEGHKADKTRPHDAECFVAGTYNDDNDTYTPCEPWSKDVDRVDHAAVGFCSLCQHDIHGRAAHNDDDRDCVCDDCGAVLHDLDWDERCPNVIYCNVCGKAFAADGQGDAVRPFVQLTGNDLIVAHSYGKPIPLNYVFHTCFCKRMVHHDHTWIPKPGGLQGEEICSDAPDGTGGCGMERSHDQEHCDLDKCIPYGKCGKWFCRLCGKDISNYEGAPSIHGNKTDHGYEPEKDGAGKIIYCATCKHKFKGVKCGTDENGVHTPFRLMVEELHSGWKPQSGTLGARDTYHECACKAYARFHNWDDYSAVSINSRRHNVLRKCHLDRFDDCEHKGSYEDNHNFTWYTDPQTGLPHFVINPDDSSKCGAATVCKTISGGRNIGCGYQSNDWGSHDFRYRENVGLDPQYELASTDKDSYRYSYHVHKMVCQHRSRGNDGEMHNCGCGYSKPIDEYAESEMSFHEKVYTSEPLDPTNHITTARCEKRNLGCLYEKEKTNRHNPSCVYEWCDVDSHIPHYTCSIDKSENPHCGFEWWDYDDKQDHATTHTYVWKDDHDHTDKKYCSICKTRWNNDVTHDGYYDLWWLEYEDLPDEGLHQKWNHCDKCDPDNLEEYNYTAKEFHFVLCDDWELSEDEYTLDHATCYFCGGEWDSQHEFYAATSILPDGTVGSDAHYCQHMTRHQGLGEEYSEAHLWGDHDGVPCWVCGWEGEWSRKCHYCSCCDDQTCLYGFDDNGRCKCPSCQSSQSQEPCYCSEYVRMLKFTAPYVAEYQFLRAYVGSGGVSIDAVDPVYEVGRSGFQEAFMSSDFQTANFGALTNAHECAFLEAFKECLSLMSVNFGRLVIADDESFKRAFENTYMTSLSLYSLVWAGSGAFDGAFSIDPSIVVGDFPWMDVSVPNLREVGESAFANNNKIKELSLPSVTNIGAYAFANCTNLWLVDFRGMTNVPHLASANAFTNLAEDAYIIVDEEAYDAWRVATNWCDIADMIVCTHGYDTNCDLYVSSIFGKDTFDGRSPKRPKRTLEAAVAAGTNKTIGVMFGDYETPEYFNKTSAPSQGTPYPVYIVGLDDKSLVRLHGTGRIVGYALQDGMPKTSFENVTITHKKKTETSSTSHYFMMCIFYNCVFKDCDTRPNNNPIWEASLLENCLIENCSIVPVGGNGGGYYYNPHVFYGCYTYNTIMNFTNANKGNLVFQCEADFENCYISGGKFDNLQSKYAGQYPPPQGAAFYDCTIIPESVNYVNWYPGYGNPSTDYGFTPVATNCIIGVDGQTNNPPWQTASICTNRATAIEAIDPNTLMPKAEYEDWQGRGFKRLPEALLAPSAKNGGNRKIPPSRRKVDFTYKVSPVNDEN